MVVLDSPGQEWEGVMAAMLRFLVALLVVCPLTVASAETPPPTRLRGTIVTVDDHVLTIATRDGQTVRVTMNDGAKIAAVQPVDASAIKPGTFIGTAAIPGSNGELQALEVVVFPEEMRGTGEGHYDWDLQPGSTMTNATVDAVVQSVEGGRMKLSYKGGSVSVVIPPKAPIVTFVPADPGELKPGVAIYTPALRAPDGSLSTARVLIGRNGVKPPM